MAIGDLVSKILFDVSANTSQAQTSLGDLKKKFDDINKVTGQVKEFVDIALDSMHSYAHRMDLESAAAGVSIEGLRKASRGLKSEMELLTHAAVFNKSAFQLTQSQMEKVESAMFALEERGRDANEVWSAMQSLLDKGTTRSLEALIGPIDKSGLAFDAAGDKLTDYSKKQELVSRAMARLTEVSKEQEGQQLDAADATDAQIVRLQDMFDKAKQKLGEIVATVGGPLLTALGNSIERTIKLVNMLPKGPGGGSLLTYMPGVEGLNKLDDYEKGFAVKDLFGYVPGAETPTGTYEANRLGDWGSGSTRLDESALYTTMNKFTKIVDDYNKKLEAIAKTPHDVKHMVRVRKPGALDAQNTEIDWYAKTGYDSDPRANYSGYGFKSAGDMSDLSGLISDIDEEQQSEIRSRESRYEDWLSSGRGTESNDSFLAKTFGPLEEFDQYRAAFEGFSTAIEGTYEAIITGSEPASKAFKRLIADQIMGIGKKSAIEALKELAYAAGSFALGNAPGGAMHLQAAGMHAAVAVAAGAAAHAIGTSAQVANADKAAAAKAKEEEKAKKEAEKRGGGSGSGGGSQNQPPVIVVIGENYSNMSPRERAREAERTVSLALGGAAGADS
jgi:hypothetical protein